MKTMGHRLMLVTIVGCSLLLTARLNQAAAQERAEKAKDIVDTAAANEDFSTLVKLVKQAELVETLKGKGPFTVFAPTNKAFKKLGQQKLDELMRSENKKKLRSILTYHVVPRSLTGSQVTGLKRLKTVNGQYLTIKTKNGQVMVDDAKVTQTDITCRNGIIHVIDAVVTPKEKKKEKDSPE